MFVCALLFYFYMRQRRRRQRLALHRAAHTSLLHSSSLSLPGAANPGQADKFSRVLTRDSGTSLSLREPRMEEKLFPVTTPRDAQVEALDRRYLDYRSGTGMAQSLVDARHARFGGPAVRHAGAISFDTVAPLRARLPPSPLQHQQPLDGNSSSSSSKRDATPATPAHASVSASAACSQRSLLDTSAANPSLAAGAGNASKPRKLLRDTCRTAGGGNASTSSSSAGSPVASPDQSSGSSKTAKPASPLLDSIESISDSYQFAVRHRPPLGPLRVVEPHVPALADELAVDRGHHMFVVGEFADGWVLAVNISRNSECGMIPRRCLFFPTAAFMTHDALASA
ncbi:hypothetical protein GGI15_003201 [Coemansia interrupta]|uniref:SH3 domain-containing protein n=1 Tax=Coemansia interrupta TaxID=1126814 RepID=A0A9W8HDN5_9FUNG|nr:hypothetical protein GGI15_003201 [Coemansia interrupta]